MKEKKEKEKVKKEKKKKEKKDQNKASALGTIIGRPKALEDECGIFDTGTPRHKCKRSKGCHPNAASLRRVSLTTNQTYSVPQLPFIVQVDACIQSLKCSVQLSVGTNALTKTYVRQIHNLSTFFDT